jgi:hypothetical protein
MTESLESFVEVEALREANQRLSRQLYQAKAKTDRLVEAAHQGGLDAMMALGPIVPVPVPEVDKRRTKKEEVALWHLSDWQLSKKTPTYNSEVAKQRVMLFCHKAAKITYIQREDHPIKKCVILLGGDIIEGVQIFAQQPFEIDQTIFGQFVTASRLIVDVVRYALSLYSSVEVVAEWGNHGRMGSKRSVIPSSDNLDRMTYELSRQLLENESRLTWPENSGEDVQRVQIGSYKALLIHGDEIGRGGFASPMTIVRHADRWKAGAYPWEFQDVYTSHYHVHAEWPLADGRGAVFQTGSTESDNRYARDLMASSAIPSQRLHFIDAEKGRVTSQYRIMLDS